MASTVARSRGPDSTSNEVSADQLTTTVEKLCIGGTGHPLSGRDGPLITAVTNALSWDTRAVLFNLYTSRRSEVRWVTETSQLDREEALAFVLADLLGYELVPEEETRPATEPATARPAHAPRFAR